MTAARTVAVGAPGASVVEAADACLAALGGGIGPGYPERQKALLELLLAGVPAALPESSRQQGYLAYHRDWLVRHPVLNNGMGMAKARQVLDAFEAQTARMGTPSLDALAVSVGRHVAEPVRRNWAGALKTLAAVAGAGRGEDGRREDPFAEDPFFPVLFRVLHAAAGHAAMDLLEEAFLHHLLLRALGAPDGRERFCLAPHLQHLPDPGTEPSRRPAASFEEGYDWRALVAQSGGEAEALMVAYSRHDATISGLLEQGLHLMRQGRIDKGCELLNQAGARREQVREESPAVYHILGRFYHGGRAYYEYLVGNLTEAEKEMDCASEAVHRAIEMHAFLVPIAPLLVDIPLQKARIARRRRDWKGMERRLTEMYEMETGLRPLCRLADGRVIDYTTLEAHFSAVALKEPQRAAVDRLLTTENRLREFRRLTTKLYLIPGMVRNTQ